MNLTKSLNMFQILQNCLTFLTLMFPPSPELAIIRNHLSWIYRFICFGCAKLRFIETMLVKKMSRMLSKSIVLFDDFQAHYENFCNKSETPFVHAKEMSTFEFRAELNMS